MAANANPPVERFHHGPSDFTGPSGGGQWGGGVGAAPSGWEGSPALAPAHDSPYLLHGPPYPAHDPPAYSSYEAPTHYSAPPDIQHYPIHQPVLSSKHYTSGGLGKHGAAMSALTLLAFLFFLNILQQCLKDHMASMTSPQVMIMSASRDGVDINADQPHIRSKFDKSGTVEVIRPDDNLNFAVPQMDEFKIRDKVFVTATETNSDNKFKIHFN